MRTLLSIGRFAQITQLSIKALHLFEAMDLLRPAFVDRDSGYRYYTITQLPLARRIRLLRAIAARRHPRRGPRRRRGGHGRAFAHAAAAHCRPHSHRPSGRRRGISLLYPIAPYLVLRYSDDALMVTLFTAIYAAAQFLAAPVLGRLGDIVGRRPVLLVSLLGSAIGYVILGIGRALWIVLLSRLIDGITAGNQSVATAYIADVTTDDTRARDFALVGLAWGIGLVVGPAAGAALGQWLHVRVSGHCQHRNLVSGRTVWRTTVAHRGRVGLHRRHDYAGAAAGRAADGALG